jgi:hypothetical protein
LAKNKSFLTNDKRQTAQKRDLPFSPASLTRNGVIENSAGAPSAETTVAGYDKYAGDCKTKQIPKTNIKISGHHSFFERCPFCIFSESIIIRFQFRILIWGIFGY